MGYWMRPSIKTKCFIGKVDKFPSFNISKLRIDEQSLPTVEIIQDTLLLIKFHCSEVHLLLMTPFPPLSTPFQKCWKIIGGCNMLLQVIQLWVKWHRDRKENCWLSFRVAVQHDQKREAFFAQDCGNCNIGFHLFNSFLKRLSSVCCGKTIFG